jgi:hypothetical protein
MVAQCVSPIQARVARLIKLDVCGNPVTGASSAVSVVDGFVSINPSPQYLDGEEHQQRKANGALCVYQKDPSELTRVDLEINWCVMDPDALVIVTGERLLTTGSATGTGVAYGTGQLTARFSLEVWQPITGPGSCDASGVQRYLYWAFMNAGNSKVGDFSFQNDVFQFQNTAETQVVGPLWLSRSGAATWLGSNTIDSSSEHFLHNITTGTPPTATCGAVLLA